MLEAFGNPFKCGCWQLWDYCLVYLTIIIQKKPGGCVIPNSSLNSTQLAHAWGPPWHQKVVPVPQLPPSQKITSVASPTAATFYFLKRAAKPSAGTFSGTLLNLTWLHQSLRDLLRRLFRNPVEPDLALHQSLPKPSPEPSSESSLWRCSFFFDSQVGQLLAVRLLMESLRRELAKRASTKSLYRALFNSLQQMLRRGLLY